MYHCICADPPWKFSKNDKIVMRSVTNHYRTMPLNEIMALPVQQYTAKDCALFLWVTDPFLDRAMDVIKAWGFKYRTVGFYWVKTGKKTPFPMGCGWWTRANPEVCLLATKGHPKPLAKDVRRLVISPRREHSRKPDCIYDEYIPKLVEGPYLELFARTQRPGWDIAFSDQPSRFKAKSQAPVSVSPPMLP